VADGPAGCHVRTNKIFAKENLEPERVAGLQLEEVESANIGGDETWLITLSVIDPKAVPPIFSPSLGQRREYKVFTVFKENGQVTSMKIRELAAT
jgi:hypothetical protein